DSPVATWLMMKRGAEIVALHLDTGPSDVKRQMEAISRWAPNHPIRFYNVPFAFILDELVRLGTKLTCVLCKRMMYRIAKRVMEIEGCDGVITGSSLGQVASQTSRNLMVEMTGLDIPLYHPLIAMDKTEVM
ncbi:tRNA 4-thiouridine(8) synthase ThiI, partial [Methanosarcinales archaeon]